MLFQSPAAQFDATIAEVLALTHQQIINEAKRLNEEILNSDPRPLGFVRHVDGVIAPEEALKPGGVIVYDYNRLDVIAKRALEILREISPVGKGRDPHPGLYRNSHRLFVDGHSVESLSDWHEGQEVSITNTVVYSQVIEVGGRGGKKFRIDGGGRVYQRAQQILKRDPDIRNAADIEFTFRAVFGAGQVNQLTQGKTTPKRGSKGRFVYQGGSRAHNKSEVRWPTITINPAGSFMSRAGLN
jgi:hypothetical protein